MEKRDIEYYQKRRQEKKKQRETEQRKQITVAVAVILFGLLIIGSIISKPSIAKIKSTTNNAKTFSKKEHVVLASNGKTKIFLPFSSTKLTAIGYHEAFNPRSFMLSPRGKKINTKKLSKGAYQRLKSKQDMLIYSLMGRSRRGGPKNSAIDVGAKAGTNVYAPIAGKVELIRKYMLYNRYPDYEVHIKPSGYSDRHLVIIHIGDIKVKQGDNVLPGIHPVGKVRRLSKFFKQQLSDYSKETGDHAHFQINKIVNGKCHIERS